MKEECRKCLGMKLEEGVPGRERCVCAKALRWGKCIIVVENQRKSYERLIHQGLLSIGLLPLWGP